MLTDKRPDIEIDLKYHLEIACAPFIVAEGTYRCHESFRVICISDLHQQVRSMRTSELRLEIKNCDNALGGTTWISVSRYFNKLSSNAFDVTDEFIKMKQEIYMHMLHKLLKDYYDSLDYPFDIDPPKSISRGAWRIICTAPNEFKWDDLVKNNLGEIVYVARNKPNGAEIYNIEKACLRLININK